MVTAVTGEIAASILVLSEDGGHRVVRALVAQILPWLAGGPAPGTIDLEPDDEGAQDAIHANLWKGKDRRGDGHRRRVELARLIATKILSPKGYVFIHIDADRRWKDRKKNPSENLARYAKDLCLLVERHVSEHLRKMGSAKDVPAVLSRLCLLSPYYSIESWLLQNTEMARRLCHKHHRGGHVETFDAWERDRAGLDEIEQPKKASCLGARHNYDLARTAYPVETAYAVGKSFAESVDRLKGCVPLLASLSAAGREQA